MRHRFLVLHPVTACVLLTLLAGCSDIGTEPTATAPPPTGTTVSFARDVQPILNSRCTGCHGGSGGLFVGTVQQLLTTGNHKPVVIPGNSAQSVLIAKLSPTPPFGDRMPRGGPYLADSTVQVIRTWIDQGAQDN